jgi:hypothetical protein
MAILTTTEKNNLANDYAADALYGAVYTTTPTSSAGTEPSGGSPAYARKSLSWSSSHRVHSPLPSPTPRARAVGGRAFGPGPN